MIRLLIFLAIAAGVGAPVFLSARDHARKSAATRRRLVMGAIVGIAASLLAALWVPQLVPPTQGSPATIVAIVLLWVVGGGFAFLFAAMLAGALLGKTRNGTEI